MSAIGMFFKKNKTEKAHVFFPATQSLLDEKGEPILWELRAISARENEEIQEQCLVEIPVGKGGQYRQKLNGGKYARMLVAASVVVPDLMNAELQDSYGVKKADELVQEMVDGAGEWNTFLEFVNRLNGFTGMAEDVDEAKN